MYIDIHILQTVPPSNINRDDTGSPKTAIFGGTRRARVSSQSWKRATRKRFNLTLDKSDIGFRTRRLAELLGDRIAEHSPGLSAEEAYALASKIFGSAGIKMTSPKVPKGQAKKPDESGYLVFLSAHQLEALAELGAAAHESGESLDKKRIKEIVNSDNSIDVALFGRMIADDAELNVDAAVQVAHALSVNSVEQEFDYFTAVDDFQESQHETGAGMIGTVEFNSSTLYRYATVNVRALESNLGDTNAASRAAAAFVDSFALSMPTGKLNTFANNVVPECVLVCVRVDQPSSLVGAFEEAVRPESLGGTLSTAARRLAERESDIESVYGGPRERFFTALNPAAGELSGLGEQVTMTELADRVASIVLSELSATA